MEPLTEEQWTELFGACQHSAWHLETRDWYGVDDEKGRYARFLATGHRDAGSCSSGLLIRMGPVRSGRVGAAVQRNPDGYCGSPVLL